MGRRLLQLRHQRVWLKSEFVVVEAQVQVQVQVRAWEGPRAQEERKKTKTTTTSTRWRRRRRRRRMTTMTRAMRTLQWPNMEQKTTGHAVLLTTTRIKTMMKKKTKTRIASVLAAASSLKLLSFRPYRPLHLTRGSQRPQQPQSQNLSCSGSCSCYYYCCRCRP